MRFHHYLKGIACTVTITFLIGCQKEIKEKTLSGVVTNDALITTTNCKPVGLGLLVRIPNQPQKWLNLMLKWYDGNGRLQFLKAVFDQLYSNFPNNEFTLDYGELTYDNDMVYLRDVSSNKNIFKVKLDAMHRPWTSWFDGLFHGIPMRDTTHLYYSASGRLDSLISTYKIGTTPQDPTLTIIYRCEYDVNGNITHLTGDLGTVRVNFKYDYTQLNPGIIPHYVISIPIKLLEFMDLLELPHHNLLTSAVSGAYVQGQGYPDDTYAVYRWNWLSPQKNSTGQIYYCEDGIGYPDNGIFYSAWDCGSPTLIQSKNPTQKEFMKLIKH